MVAQRVRVLEAAQHLARQVRRGGGRHALAARLARAQHVDQVDAVDVLERHVIGAVDLPEVVEPHDVLVIEADGDARLVDEHADELTVGREARQDALDDACALDAARLAARQEHLGHAADGEELYQLVAAEGAERRRPVGRAVRRGAMRTREVGVRRHAVRPHGTKRNTDVGSTR